MTPMDDIEANEQRLADLERRVAELEAQLRPTLPPPPKQPRGKPDEATMAKGIADQFTRGQAKLGERVRKLRAKRGPVDVVVDLAEEPKEPSDA